MARLLADANFPLPSVDALRASGHDVAVLALESATWADPAVFDAARADQRTLLTFDRDFGDLIFRHGHPPCPGVIYLRMPTDPPDRPVIRILDLLADPEAHVTERFTILEGRVPRRRLPGQ